MKRTDNTLFFSAGRNFILFLYSFNSYSQPGKSLRIGQRISDINIVYDEWTGCWMSVDQSFYPT